MSQFLEQRRRPAGQRTGMFHLEIAQRAIYDRARLRHGRCRFDQGRLICTAGEALVRRKTRMDQRTRERRHRVAGTGRRGGQCASTSTVHTLELACCVCNHAERISHLLRIGRPAQGINHPLHANIWPEDLADDRRRNLPRDDQAPSGPGRRGSLSSTPP